MLWKCSHAQYSYYLKTQQGSCCIIKYLRPVYMYTGSSSMAMRICTNFGTAVGLLLLLTSCVNSQSAFDRCHLLFPKEACYAVFTSLKENLLNNTINIYELQRAFYPMGRFTSSVLLNILYSVNFTDTSSLSDTPVCIGVSNSSWLLENGGYQFLTGWSSSEIFNVISPLQLSQIQLQISNDIFSLFIIPGSGVAYPRRFGWADMIRDAQNSLVKLESTNLVNINITLDTISCVPDTELLHSSLQEITIMVSNDLLHFMVYVHVWKKNYYEYNNSNVIA